MTVISTKPNTKLPWASQGNRAEPTSDKQLEGWSQEIPPHEMENWVQYKQDLAIKYLYQEGIPEWDSSFEYNTTSYVKYGGVIYKLKAGAEVPNTAKQPDSEVGSWEVAFEPYGTSSPLLEEIRKIKELEGYLALYVSKANPVMDGIAIAPEFQATTEGGHTFQGAGADTGIFLNSNNEPEFKINNVTKGTVRNTPSLSSSDTTLVTTAMLQQFKTDMFLTVLPIGISIITQDPRNPAEYLGFGSWERDLEGRALVGVTTDVTSASPDWVKQVNKTEGEYKHTMTVSELVPHEHGISVFRVEGATTSSSVSDVVKNSPPPIRNFTTQSSGEGQPFNIVQPSKTKFIFTRVG
jgi:hypothetical protein